jgi:hypothetical protein
MLGEPRAYELAVVAAEVVAKQVNERDGLGRVAVDLLQKLDEFHLSLAPPQDADHLAAATQEQLEAGSAHGRRRWCRCRCAEVP